MCKTLNIMDIVYSSSVDGTGFRDVLFVNYCPHHCEGCHNSKTWDKENGKEITIQDVFENLTKSNLTNITYSGGEPFEQTDSLIELSRLIRENTNKTIWIYSGYTFEEIQKDPKKKELLYMCDVLVDGKFDIHKTGLNLKFKGSTNQRIIDIKKSHKNIVLFDDSFN